MIGDRILDSGIEYEVVFDGRQSLLGDYPRQSTLADVARDHRTPNRSRERRPYTRQRRTYQKARDAIRRSLGR